MVHRPAKTTPYEQHRDFVLAVLARRCRWLDSADREAALHDAYAVMLDKQRNGELDVEGMHAPQLRAYLVQTAIYKALDEGKRAERKRTIALADTATAEADPGATVEDVVAAGIDSLPVREMLAELSGRRRQIIVLRYCLDQSPEEIQQLLDITERVYRREHERAVRQLAELHHIVRSGRWCERRRSLILAYVSGIAGPTRTHHARSHIASCRGCAHLAAEMRGHTLEAGRSRGTTARRPDPRSRVVAC